MPQGFSQITEQEEHLIIHNHFYFKCLMSLFNG